MFIHFRKRNVIIPYLLRLFGEKILPQCWDSSDSPAVWVDDLPKKTAAKAVMNC